MNALAMVTLRILLVLMAAGSLLVQLVIIPLMAEDAALSFPEAGHLRVPYTVLAITMVACFEVVLVAVWRLLSMVARSEIFAASALAWVRVIIVADLVAVVIASGLGVHLLAVVRAGGPAVVLGLGAMVVGGGAFALLMTVMRGLLVNATTFKNELDEVV